jgi:crotonobetainyl-CoA:carnitine CoA-transferase CaiB-like acyl-CoA transferase
MARTICEGLRVIEMGAGSIGASIAGMLLADNGARVVKIEPPEGDRLREQHPGGFLVWNRGKESLIADLRHEQGRSQVRHLAARADVLIEGFGAGVADGWGLGYDDLRIGNQRLVYCSVKGFGPTGAYAHIPAYEGVVAAKTGLFQLGPFGYRSGPIFFSAFLASSGAGHQALAAILAALIAREQTGRGQRVDATLVQGLTPLDYFGVMTWQHLQRTAGTAEGSSAFAGVQASRYNFFVPTQDGRWVVFTQMLPHQARALSGAVGLEHTIQDPRFADQPQFTTAEDAQAWEDLVWEAMSKEPYEHWERVFLADPDIAFELARFSEEGLDHQQIVHNGEAVTVEDADLGAVQQVGPVAHFSRSPARIHRMAPRLGNNSGDFPDHPASAPGSGGPWPPHSLADVTIVELGYFYAMPYGVTMAGALGARIIKIEGPAGDPMRYSFGAAEVGGAKTMEGKESLAVDLQTLEGQEIVRSLVARADVFVNGFRSGVAERLGLGYKDLSAFNPRLVFIHAAGYGVDGPYAHRPIYAQVAQAVAGSLGRYGGTWLDPELTKGFSTMEAQVVVMPRIRGPVDGDSNASLAVLSAIALGVYDQRRTGEGQFLSTTMIGGNAWAYADDFLRYRGKPALPVADGEYHGLGALYRLYQAASGWVFLAASREKEWQKLAAAIERTDLLADSRFSTAALRRVNDSALIDELARLFATRPADEWEAVLVPRGVACVAAFGASHSEFTCTDLVLRETGLVVEVEHPLFGRILRHGAPVAFSETPPRLEPGSLVGQHTEELLREIGYDADRIVDLKARKVVFG